MARTFQHGGHEWAVELSGGAHGVGSAFPPTLTSFGVLFRRLGVTEEREPYYGSIHTQDLSSVTDEQLRASLEDSLRQAVIRALEDPKWDWRTLSGVAADTGLSEESARLIIESNPEEFIRSRTPSREGQALYSTRRHYAGNRNLLDRFRTS